MTLTYGSNLAALTISKHLTSITSQLNKSLERLSTGIRINHASDGAANMMISESLTSQIRGYITAASNAQQGVSMLEIADGALQEISGHLQSIRDIAVAANSSFTTTDQFAAYQANLQAEIAAIDHISDNAKFGTNVLLDGSISGGAALNVQIGANSGDTLDIKSAFTDNSTSGLGVSQNTLTTAANANTLLGQVDAAISSLSANQARIGGFSNRLNDQINYLSIAQSNTAAAQSSIRDTDVAMETANLTRLQIIQQAAAYALAQANIQSQLALKLLP
jgi:flagellin